MNHFRLRFGPFQWPKARIGALHNLSVTVRFESPLTKRALLERIEHFFAPGSEGEETIVDVVPQPRRQARLTLAMMRAAVRAGLVRVRRKVVTP